VRHSRLVPDPNWTASPIAAELEELIRALRETGTVAKHVTLTGLLDTWSGLVEAVELGYEESVYEYANDIDSRAILERVAAEATPRASSALHLWLRPWDERYETATQRATAPFHERADPSSPYAASPWHWRIPRRLVGELRSDLEAMNLA
jgi:hypothetical protein